MNHRLNASRLGLPRQADDYARFDEAVNTLLTGAYRYLIAGNAVAALRLLNRPLTELWNEACVRDGPWKERMRIQCRTHPLRVALHRDPYTRHAWTKPRGYAGDAELLDYIYRTEVPCGMDPIGRSIFPVITRAFMSMSLRFRRQLLRSLVDDTVALIPQARILSLAAGHARELEGSLVASGMFDVEFVAVDHDPLCCAEIDRAHAGQRVRTLNLGVVDLLRCKDHELGTFDLIYSAAVFDSLGDALALRLVKYLLRSLRPGGRLLIANFVPDTKDRGYMELFMDWHLAYRTEEQLLEIAREAGGKVLRSFLDSHRNVAYVELALESSHVVKRRGGRQRDAIAPGAANERA